MTELITQEKLKSLLRYEPETGNFYRLKNGKLTGSKAGKFLTIYVMGKPYKAHHLAWLYMLGVFPENFLTHKNRNSSDNSWENIISRSPRITKGKKIELTQDILRDLLHYNPETGHFYWIHEGSGRDITKPAGTVGYQGYICIEVLGGTYKAHKLAWFYMTGEWPKKTIDHKNVCPSDNRWLNLRQATHSQNCVNQGMRKTNKSGYKGVCWNKEKGKWVVQCRVNKKSNYVGAFDDPELAGLVYQEFAQKHHGEFYREVSGCQA